MGRKRRKKKKRSTGEGEGSAPRDAPLNPGPRQVPIDWQLWTRLGVTTFVMTIMGAMMSFFVGLGVGNMAGLHDVFMLVTASAGLLLVHAFLLWYLGRDVRLLREGVAVKPKVLSAKKTKHGYSSTSTGRTFDIYSGWEKVAVVREYSVVTKELLLELPDGQTHTITVDTHERRPPMYLVAPANPKVFIAVDKLEIDILAPVEGEWPAVPLQLKTKIWLALNILLLMAVAVGLPWSLWALLS